MGLIASAQGLEIIKKRRVAKGWACQACKWYEEANVSLATLKRFTRGKPISDDNFKAICEAVGVGWEQIVDWEKGVQNRVEDNPDIAQICPMEDCNEMPDLQVFFGREQELENLKQSILRNRSRVAILCGQPGIGKTALAAKLTEEVKYDFEYFSWRSLNDSVAPSLLKLLLGLIKSLCSEEETNLPNDVDELIDKLLKFFSNNRVLLVLDGWENISRTQSMEGFQTDYEKYSKLLKRIAERRHKSCVVITTQEEPNELLALQDTLFIKTRLNGLGFEASLNILTAKQLIFKQDQAKNLINNYSGNPLFLLHICEHIKTVFRGSLTKYENFYTFLVPLGYKDAIKKSCESLSKTEVEVLKIIVTEHYPIDYEKLKSKIQNNSDLSNSDLQKALSSILMRSLVEINSQGSEILYTLQPIIRKCIREFFQII